MAFIRSKGKRGWRGDLTSHYLVESRRVNGKVRQKVLLYLGPCDSIKSALMHFRQQAWYWQKRAQGYALRYLYTPRTRDGRQWRNGEEFKIVPSALTSAELEQATKELKLGLKCIL